MWMENVLAALNTVALTIFCGLRRCAAVPPGPPRDPNRFVGWVPRAGIGVEIRSDPGGAISTTGGGDVFAGQLDY